MKPGANTQDQFAIKRMAAEGASAEEISAALQIELATVESFVEHFSPKAEPDQKDLDFDDSKYE